MVSKGRVRVNGARMAKPGHAIAVGDVLTFAQGDVVRLIRIAALGTRRGPYSEAQTHYIDMDAAPTPLE